MDSAPWRGAGGLTTTYLPRNLTFRVFSFFLTLFWPSKIRHHHAHHPLSAWHPQASSRGLGPLSITKGHSELRVNPTQTIARMGQSPSGPSCQSFPPSIFTSNKDRAVKQSVWQIPWRINHFCTIYVIRSDPWDNFYFDSTFANFLRGLTE